MDYLLNHMSLCTFIYCGNVEGALELFDTHLKSLKTSTCFAHSKLFVTSLNFSIYNYILLKENISLHQCCLNNHVQINTALDHPTLVCVGREMIHAYAYCQDYLFEKYEHPEIKKAIQYIHKNLNSCINFEEICRLTNLNKSYFCTLFRQHTHYTVSQYINHARINMAKSLLKDAQLSMSEVAFRCGFNSYPYFCKVFKEITGLSPSHFPTHPTPLSTFY